MAIGMSLFLMTIGAVLALAVNVPASGFDVDAAGVILMALGLGTFLYTLVWWGDHLPGHHDKIVIRERHVHEPHRDREVVREREVIEYERRAG